MIYPLHKSGKWQRIRDVLKTSFLVNIILAFAVFGVVWSGIRMGVQALSMRRESEDMNRKIAELRQKKAQLEAYVQELQTKEAVERRAKERLNLKKPGEEVVVVMPPEKKEEPQAHEATTTWDKIKGFFGQ